jgi:hypothetical protein
MKSARKEESDSLKLFMLMCSSALLGARHVGRCIEGRFELGTMETLPEQSHLFCVTAIKKLGTVVV